MNYSPLHMTLHPFFWFVRLEEVGFIGDECTAIFWVVSNMSQGKALDLRERQLVVQLKQYFDQERLAGPFVSTKSPAGRVAAALGIGLRTVKDILSTYHQTGHVPLPELEHKGKPPYRIHPAFETVIRQRIRELNRQGSHVSLRALAHWFSQNYEEMTPATLWRSLQRLGFVYGSSRHRSGLKERDDVLIARRRYLRAKLANRKPQGGTRRPEVYVDETYVNVNHSTKRTWYYAEEGPWVQKPSGKGPRLIIVDAITAEGWVPGARLVFQAKRRTGDYHGQMNHDNFQKWFQELLVPHIPAKSLIIMDNAPYHNVYVEGAFYPTTSTRKKDLQSWLLANQPEAYQETMIKAELLAVCKHLCEQPPYALDQLAEAAGHQILRTPQYHPELQPIEECWGVVKNHCAEECDYTLSGLWNQVEEGFRKVTAKTCRAALADMRREEDRYWVEDMEDDKALETKE
jgi:transposase